MYKDMFDTMPSWPKKVVVLGFNPLSMAPDKRGTTSVTGVVHLDDCSCCLTVFTKQNFNQLLDILATDERDARTIIVSGSWAKKSVKGNSGEVYTPLIGTVELLAC